MQLPNAPKSKLMKNFKNKNHMKKIILYIITLFATNTSFAQLQMVNLTRTHFPIGDNETNIINVDLMLHYELFITAVNEHYNEPAQKHVWTVKVYNNESYAVKVHVAVSDYHDMQSMNSIEPRSNYQADCIPSKTSKEFSLFFANSPKQINVWVKNPNKCEE